MRRSALIAILMALPLAACGEKPSEETGAPALAAETTPVQAEAVPEDTSTKEAASAPAATSTEAAPEEAPAPADSTENEGDEPAQN
jgi:hypothetical protein